MRGVRLARKRTRRRGGSGLCAGVTAQCVGAWRAAAGEQPNREDGGGVVWADRVDAEWTVHGFDSRYAAAAMLRRGEIARGG